VGRGVAKVHQLEIEMQERVTDITTADGKMNMYIIHPDSDGPFPVVIFYMDSVGVREELLDMCRRIASVGYYVLLPNIYYRMVRSFDFDAKRVKDPAYGEKVAELWKLSRHLTNTRVADDTRAMFEFLDSERAARPGKVGITGHCMSGRFVFHLAGAFPDRVAASAAFYGGNFISDTLDSAHLLAGNIKGEMYFAFAEYDDFVPPGMLEAVQRIIDDTKINARIETYQEAHHGFAFPNRRAYDKRSAERHWERLFDMWRRNL
jgi:carboxymethylenebutenolidase